MMTVPTPTFVPTATQVRESAMTAFTRFVETETGEAFPDYAALHRFSVREFRLFWRLLLRWSALAWDGAIEPACVGNEVEQALFFPGVRLNYAENLLRTGAAPDTHLAIIARSERGERVALTRGELRQRVRRAAAGLRSLGVAPGDRVIAVARNTADAVVACLASAAIGAVWSSVSPDLGTDAVLGRFSQLEPTLLFAHGSYTHHGVTRPLDARIAAVAEALPSLRTVVALDDGALPATGGLAQTTLSALEAAGARHDAEPWARLPFNHPLFILFSSGTTGAPKCIAHGAGGTLLEHVKEHRLHSGFGPDDRLYFHTSCGWMMWNWLVSALASGTTIVLYDGSPTYPEQDALWRLLAEEEVTVFGTSPAFLQLTRDAGLRPRDRVDLAALRAIQSTGSILFDNQYHWVRDAVKPVSVQSISGGTDIIGCFVLGNPNLPVYPGEAQCLSLALDVRALPPDDAIYEDTGELICAAPFPSRPLGLFGDPGGEQFHGAYFAQHPGVWTHGDYIELTARGSARILGRSDGVLNVRGIRIGPAEIYHILQDIPEIAEAMVVEQAAPDEPGGSRLVLLVVLKPDLALDRPLTLRVKKALSVRGSAAHVPGAIVQVDELPTTFSGKRSERAARDVLNGRPAANAAALRNPECLDRLRAHPDLHVAQAGAP